MVTLNQFKYCNACKWRVATWDTPTRLGPWAHLCDDCMEVLGIKTSVTVKLEYAKECYE